MSNYNVDISGVLAANRITNEQAVIVPGSTDVHKQLPYIIPQFAPFYGPNFVIRRNGVTLTKDIDYQFAAQHLHAKAFLGKEFYGAVVFLDRTAVGNVEYDYNTLGGNYVTNDSQLLASYFNTLVQQRVINWDKVYGVPALLPPIQAQENLSQLKGTDDLVSSINAVAAAIENADFANIISMINNLGQALVDHTAVENAHGTGKDDVGLGNVGNYSALSSRGQLDDTGTSRKYLTTGDNAHWDLIRAAILQLSITDPANAMSTNNMIFHASSLADITLPNGATPTGQALVIQIATSGALTAQLTARDRVQLGVVYNTSGIECFIIRKLNAGQTTGSAPWTVIPTSSHVLDLIAQLTNSIPGIVNDVIDQRITYGEHDPTEDDFNGVGDIYFKLF